MCVECVNECLCVLGDGEVAFCAERCPESLLARKQVEQREFIFWKMYLELQFYKRGNFQPISLPSVKGGRGMSVAVFLYTFGSKKIASTS